MPSQVLTKEQKEYAKKQYMAYRTVSDIARELKVSRNTLQNYVNDTWRSERTLRRNELAAEFSESKASIMNHTFSSSFKGVKAWVDKVTSPSYDIKPHEAKTLMSIIESMDKISRLDDGKPTDIVSETKPVSVIEIKKQILQADPFQIEDASYKEVENEESQENS